MYMQYNSCQEIGWKHLFQKTLHEECKNTKSTYGDSLWYNLIGKEISF